jgi:hypothetical protein
MTEMPTPSEDRYAHLRAYAARQKQTTLDRLEQAIAQLEREGRPVTTFTIREESGLDYMAYYRNPEALALFRRHSTHLRKAREKAQTKRRRSWRQRSGPDPVPQQGTVSSRDPLLNYKKPRLGAELRAAQAQRDQMEQQYSQVLSGTNAIWTHDCAFGSTACRISCIYGAFSCIFAKRGTRTTELVKKLNAGLFDHTILWLFKTDR